MGKIYKDDVHIHLVRMPCTIRAAHTANSDGTWSVFLNDRLTHEQHQSSLEHELAHIEHGDIHSDVPASLTEAMRRMK